MLSESNKLMETPPAVRYGVGLTYSHLEQTKVYATDMRGVLYYHDCANCMECNLSKRQERVNDKTPLLPAYDCMLGKTWATSLFWIVQ